MRQLGQPLHSLEQHGAADTVVPGLAEIVVRAIQHQERRVRHHRIARADTQGCDPGGILGAYIQ